ncbi:MAG TPA: response regulator [Rhodocyclaceae bacterium]|nr:response regulator [Rhodocyclaceae bacterium]
MAVAERMRNDYPREAALVGQLVQDYRFDRIGALCDVDTAEEDLRRAFPDRRVLVVDDDPDGRQLARLQLKRVWPQVDTAEDGEQAVAVAAKGLHDLILMDLHLPGIDGIEATRRIRALPGGATLVILGTTADATPEDRRRFLAAGADDVIRQTAGPGEPFASILQSLLGRRNDRSGADA